MKKGAGIKVKKGENNAKMLISLSFFGLFRFMTAKMKKTLGQKHIFLNFLKYFDLTSLKNNPSHKQYILLNFRNIY